LNGLFIIGLLVVLVLNLIFIAFAIIDIMQRKNVKYLPKIGWILVMAFILFGSVVYLLIGREKDLPN